MNAALGAGVSFDSVLAEATQRVQELLLRDFAWDPTI